jgi:catechol 2,3-dioxygenase-like lactoylglutathione lyase family enzyme
MASIRVHFILYVADQARSTAFYEALLGMPPSLNVPGMTEFELGNDVVLGVMPETGIGRLLGVAVAAPVAEADAVRGEIYLVVEDPADYHARALSLGARELSALVPRDWGHDVAYSADPDGYVLAFARVSGAQPK